jgi:hypothetical protein
MWLIKIVISAKPRQKSTALGWRITLGYAFSPDKSPPDSRAVFARS